MNLLSGRKSKYTRRGGGGGSFSVIPAGFQS